MALFSHMMIEVDCVEALIKSGEIDGININIRVGDWTALEDEAFFLTEGGHIVSYRSYADAWAEQGPKLILKASVLYRQLCRLKQETGQSQHIYASGVQISFLSQFVIRNDLQGRMITAVERIAKLMDIAGLRGVSGGSPLDISGISNESDYVGLCCIACNHKVRDSELLYNYRYRLGVPLSEIVAGLPPER